MKKIMLDTITIKNKNPNFQSEIQVTDLKNLVNSRIRSLIKIQLIGVGSVFKLGKKHLSYNFPLPSFKNFCGRNLWINDKPYLTHCIT